MHANLLRISLVLLAVLVVGHPASHAQSQAPSQSQRKPLENENLLVGMPKGYKVGFQKRQGNQMISEWVPQAETVENWTEMVTVQVFFGMRNVALPEWRSRIEKLWADACSNSRFAKVKEGIENGFATLTWSQTCPKNATTGKPEIAWMKAISGKDSLYMVQKAFKAEPTGEQQKEWFGYLDSIGACDTREKDRPCRVGAR